MNRYSFEVNPFRDFYGLNKVGVNLPDAHLARIPHGRYRVHEHREEIPLGKSIQTDVKIIPDRFHKLQTILLVEIKFEL